MKLTRLAIRNAQFLVIVLLILTILSVRSFVSMPRAEDPEANFPVFRVMVVYPGTSPEDLEKLVIDPLEEATSKISDIDEISSTMMDGVCIMMVDASFDIDADDKYDEFLREINLVRPELPDGIVRFEVEKVKPADRVNFKIYALSSDELSYSTLKDVGEDLEDKLEDIDGISFVELNAAPEDEINIALDFERMAAQHIPLGQVINILSANNINIPGGNIDLGQQNYAIKSTGDYSSLHEIRNITISTNGVSTVRLGDIAEISITSAEALWQATYNKQKSILIGAKLKSGYNILTIDQQVQEVLSKFKADLPPTIQLSTAFDQVPSVREKIHSFLSNLLQGVLLVGLIILLFLGWRPALIIVIIIPLCTILSIAVLRSSGYALQQISIASLVLALGLLVDNGIVVIENINRLIREGIPKRQAAIEGAEEVGMAIVSSTITTLLAFFPLTQLGEAAGLFLISLPLTVIFTLIISLILALTFTPLISNWWLSDRIIRPSMADKLFHAISYQIYRPILRWSLRWGWIVMIIAIVFTVLSTSLFPRIGVSFFPTADKALLLVDIDAPGGSNLDYTRESTQYVESILDTLDIVDNYTTNVGNSNPQIYYNRIPTSFNQAHGQILVNLREFKHNTFYQTIKTLRQHFTDWPKAKITVEELKNGAPVPAPIEIKILGDNIDLIRALASDVEHILSETPEVINIDNPLSRNKTELTISLDKAKASLLGISEVEFDRTIRASLNGLKVDETILDDDESYDIVVTMPFEDQPSIEDFYKVYIANQRGTLIPLHHVAEIKFSISPPLIFHTNTQRYMPVFASVRDLDQTIAKTIEVEEQLKELDWPKGYSYSIGGEFEQQQTTFGNLGVILGLAMIAIFAVLVLQFRSILQPLIVFMAIPLAAGGSFIALYLTGWPFSFFAFVGLISLIGIVVNNSIILVDHINQLIADPEEHMTLNEAIVDGSIRRLKPIILTTMTTILGLMPLALQATNQWSPLCWTIIGGMISSTILTLLVIPILYKWFTFRRIASGE